MAKYELIGADDVLKRVAEEVGVSESVVNDAWVSQFDFMHEIIRDKSIRGEKYYSFLMLKFGRFYCKPGKFKWLKEMFGKNESI